MYNKAPYIERMVESLSKQTYIDRTKIIVVDDCSTDDSVEILKRAVDKFEIDVDLRSNRKNLGFSMALRNLYWMIETPFFTILDPDDYYIHPERLERAVKFLEANPDHSMHGCNYFREYLDGNRVLQIPESTPNCSLEKFTTNPFFQTSSATFRNFWTRELLVELERIAGHSRFNFVEGDSFRNLCAFNFGKVYFDNFVGSVYTMQVGIWHSLSKVERDVLEIISSYSMFEFTRSFFHNESDSIFLLRSAYETCLKVMDQIHSMIKDRSALNFTASDCLTETVDLPHGNFEDVLHLTFEFYKKFEALGVRDISR